MNYVKLAAGLGVIAMLYALYWGIDHNGYQRCMGEWDADKAARKAESDKQASDTTRTNQEHKHALNKTESDLSATRRERDAAFKRLRDLRTLPWKNPVSVAGSGQTPVPGVAGNPGRAGGGIQQRIGGCENTGTDPCYTSRKFFEQAISDALDRKVTREWAAGQGIIAVGNQK